MIGSAILLVSEITFLVAGAETVCFVAIVAAWLVVPAIVGFKNVLDAGCFFMLVSLGIVVDLAEHGRTPLPT